MSMTCACCGSARFRQQKVLWKELTDAWRLAAHEIAYIDQQQGLHCADCGVNLRAMALARAVMTFYGHPGPLRDFVLGDAARLSLLEINEAGKLTQFFGKMPQHVLARYPEADMTQLAFEDQRFDCVVHSDTLEHVPNPVRGLSECRRVLKPGGLCAFTVPMVVDRLTLSREGLPPSYHGSPANPADNLVRTEYGADAWKQVVLAGFRECRIFALQYPAALVLMGIR